MPPAGRNRDDVMVRLKTPDPDRLSDAQRAVYNAIASGPRGGVRGPLAIWLHRPQLADLAQSLGRYCRYDTLLPPRLSELAILVTAKVWRSEYEWQAHKPIALQAGISPEVVEAIRAGRRPDFALEDEAVVHDLAFAIQGERKIDQALYHRAAAVLGNEALVDLVGVLGYYGLISMTINMFEVDPPDPSKQEME